MNQTAFVTTYEAPRDTALLRFHKHCALPRFGYSSGVRALALTGCFKLIDLIGSTCAPKLLSTDHFFAHVYVCVRDKQGSIELVPANGLTPILYVALSYINIPDGDWKFCLLNEGDCATLILPSEH